MIWSFKRIHPKGEGWDNQFYSGKADYDFVSVDDDKTGQLMEVKHGPNHTLKFDSEGYNTYSERINKGLLLFGKYFRALWI